MNIFESYNNLKKVYCASLMKRFVYPEYLIDVFSLLAEIEGEVVDVTGYLLYKLRDLGIFTGHPYYAFCKFGDEYVYTGDDKVGVVTLDKKEAVKELKRCLSMIGLECEEARRIGEGRIQNVDTLFIMPLSDTKNFTFSCNAVAVFALDDGLKIVDVVLIESKELQSGSMYENEESIFGEKITKSFENAYHKKCKLITDVSHHVAFHVLQNKELYDKKIVEKYEHLKDIEKLYSK